MSRQEVLSWSSLAVNVVIGVWYFIATGLVPRVPLASPGLLFGLIFAAIAVAILIEVALRRLSRSADQVAQDERDVGIHRRAYRNAYAVLTVAVFYLIARIISVSWLAAAPSPAAPALVRDYWLEPLTPAAIAQLLLLGLIVAACARHLTQVICYRRGGS